MKGKSNAISFVVAYATSDSQKSEARTYFGPHQAAQAHKVLKRDNLLVMMEVNARTGRKEEGCVDGKVLGAYGRDTLNDNVWSRL